jgi:hypothetical protein
MRTVYVVMLLVSIAVGGAGAAEPQMLKEGSWLCSSPEAYDQAVMEERNWQGKDLAALKKQLLEQKLCMYVDDKYLEDMMAPFVTVLDQQGNKVQVSFTVEFNKRIRTLHRQISRVTYAGWTDVGNLRLRE